MKGAILNLRLAISFLTLLPVGNVGKGDLGKALFAFPLVGLLIGVISVTAGFACQYLLAPPLHLIAVLITATVLTGGLHLDGLADTFDALCSWRSREKKLKIMKDSRIGVMGALVLIFILLTKFVALGALASHWWVGALLAPLWGRWATFYNLHFFPRANQQGLAASIGAGSGWQFIIATAFTLSVSFFIWWQCGVPLTQQLGLLLVLCLITHALAVKMSRSLGGVTGDTCGALSELTEIALLLALSSPLFHLS
ncbi:MAG: adenosylcobinamide-GDP ribazoletransferase [Verrucomicrobiales bacterium]|nr:adenosylcobinamide-GDP ribazoletransferase [Verrucomicrobiales bacterium]